MHAVTGIAFFQEPTYPNALWVPNCMSQVLNVQSRKGKMERRPGKFPGVPTISFGGGLDIFWGKFEGKLNRELTLLLTTLVMPLNPDWPKTALQTRMPFHMLM